jgi:lipoate-protein ligase A
MTDVWRLLDTGNSPASYNMALDEAIAVTVRKDHTPPTLRLYGWSASSISIGYFQKNSDLDIDYCRQHNVPVVRRLTGGRAILHGEEITYSFSAGVSGLFSQGLYGSYKKLSTALGLALSKIGITPEMRFTKRAPRSSGHQTKSPMCFQAISYGELMAGNRKIVGSAQKRWSDGFLQQGSIPLVIEREASIRIFRAYSAQESETSFAGLRELLPEVQVETIKHAIQVSFEDTFGITLLHKSPLEEEMALARELEQTKYLSDTWTLRR